MIDRHLFMRATACILAASGAISAAPESACTHAANTEAIQRVQSGATQEANAAWWHFNENDATDGLQAAIDSGAATVVVPYMGHAWIVRPLKLRSNLTLVFEPGVILLAKGGEFKGKGDSLFSASDVEHVTLRGYGATLLMRKQDYQNAPYEPAEWRMAIDLAGCSDVCIEGLQIARSGGDGIYLGASSKQPFCANVTIRDVVCEGHHRQGISVISAENLLIERCTLKDTEGTAPEAGIDFEPNAPQEKLVNCVVRNCLFANNRGAGVLLYLKNLSKESALVSVRIENCLVQSGRDAGLAVGAISDEGPAGTIEFANCTIENTAKAGLYVYDKSRDGARVRFVNCHWKNAWADPEAKHEGQRAPLLLHVRRPAIAKRFGGIDFIDCHVYDVAERPALLVEAPAELGVADLQGTIFLRAPGTPKIELGAKAENVSLCVAPAAP